MGKRKSSRKPPVKKVEKLEVNFDCPYCSESKSTDYSADKVNMMGHINCRACFAGFTVPINKLSMAIDVYGAWLDAIEKEEKIKEGLIKPDNPNYGDFSEADESLGTSNKKNSTDLHKELFEGDEDEFSFMADLESRNSTTQKSVQNKSKYDIDEGADSDDLFGEKDDEDELDKEKDLVYDDYSDDYDQDQGFKTKDMDLVDEEEEEEENFDDKPKYKSKYTEEDDYSTKISRKRGSNLIFSDEEDSPIPPKAKSRVNHIASDEEEEEEEEFEGFEDKKSTKKVQKDPFSDDDSF